MMSALPSGTTRNGGLSFGGPTADPHGGDMVAEFLWRARLAVPRGISGRDATRLRRRV